MANTSWKLHSWQDEKLTALKGLMKSHKIVCLAACTGFGKTEVAAKLIVDNPNASFLVLAHGLTNLKNQFAERLISRVGRAHVYQADGAAEFMSSSDYRVVVTLPQTAKNCPKYLKRFDFLIVDEAHQFYDEEKSMYATILGGLKKSCKRFLLTASHYEVEAEKVFFSREEAFAKSTADDVNVQLLETAQKLSHDDFNANDELKKDIDLALAPIWKQIKPFLDKKHFPLVISVSGIGVAEKLMRQLKKFKIGEKKIAAIGSWSDGGGNDSSMADRNGKNLEAFVSGKYDVCVVVNRATLGFDYPALRTFIDASFSMNIVRIEQMIGRLMRRHPSSPNKQFVKLCAAPLWDYTQIIMAAVMGLSETEHYKAFDGKYNTTVARERPLPTQGNGGEKSSEGEEKGDSKRSNPRKLEITFQAYLEYMKEREKEGDSCSLKEALAKCKGTVYKDPEGRAEKLKKFIIENGRAPKESEGILGRAHPKYLSPKTTTYNPDYAAFCAEHGITVKAGRNSTSTEDKIKRAIKEWSNGKGSISKTVENWIRAGRRYIPEVREALVAAGWQSNKIATQVKIEYVLNQYKTERGLDKLARRYISPSSHQFCAEAREALIAAGWNPKVNVTKGKCI